MELLKEVKLLRERAVEARGQKIIRFTSDALDRVYLGEGVIEIHVRIGTSAAVAPRIVCIPLLGVVSFERFAGAVPAEVARGPELQSAVSNWEQPKQIETIQAEDDDEDAALDLPATGEQTEEEMEEEFDESPPVPGEEKEAVMTVENPQVFKKQPKGTMAQQRRANGENLR
jgi:hypothetical protein